MPYLSKVDYEHEKATLKLFRECGISRQRDKGFWSAIRNESAMIAHQDNNAFKHKIRQLPQPAESLIRSELFELLKLANLTQPQLEVLLLRADGCTFEDIAEKRTTTKQGAQHVCAQAMRKLKKAKSPYAGLWQVYHQLVHRRGAYLA